jgi:hypothetical protein
MALQNIRQKGAAAAAVAGLGALLVGCGANALPNAQVQAMAAAGAPMSIACEPNQRAVVRQVVVNGVMQAQGECVTAVPGVATANGYGAAAPVSYAAAPAPVPVNYVPGYGYTQAAIPETRLVQPVYTQPAVRTVEPRRLSTQRVERSVRPKRSVKKSAVIIGSSAGVGAGVGALVGGKKGAGIGALVGGGGAALWDQLTRRQ